MNADDKIIEQVALEVVLQVRRLHFQEGTSQAARTKKIKEIIEKNSRKMNSDAS